MVMHTRREQSRQSTNEKFYAFLHVWLSLFSMVEVSGTPSGEARAKWRGCKNKEAIKYNYQTEEFHEQYFKTKK